MPIRPMFGPVYKRQLSIWKVQKGKSAISQKRGMRTAMGSAKWLTVRNHLTTSHALEAVWDEYHITVCTDGNRHSKDI